jgi:hypothetical protein
VRQRDRDRERYRETERDRQTVRRRERDRQRETERKRDRERDRDRETEIERQRDRQRETDRQTDSETERQTEGDGVGRVRLTCDQGLVDVRRARHNHTISRHARSRKHLNDIPLDTKNRRGEVLGVIMNVDFMQVQVGDCEVTFLDEVYVDKFSFFSCVVRQVVAAADTTAAAVVVIFTLITFTVTGTIAVTGAVFISLQISVPTCCY